MKQNYCIFLWYVFFETLEDMEGMLGDTSVFSQFRGKGLGKGHGEGGKCKLKGKGPAFLAILDKPRAAPKEKTEKQLVDDACNRGRKMRDLCFATANNFQDALELVKKSKYWSKAAHKDADQKLAELKSMGDSLKKFLSKGPSDVPLIKGTIMEAGLVVKAALVSIREFKALAVKSASVASTKK